MGGDERGRPARRRPHLRQYGQGDRSVRARLALSADAVRPLRRRAGGRTAAGARRCAVGAGDARPQTVPRQGQLRDLPQRPRVQRRRFPQHRHSGSRRPAARSWPRDRRGRGRRRPVQLSRAVQRRQPPGLHGARLACRPWRRAHPRLQDPIAARCRRPAALYACRADADARSGARPLFACAGEPWRGIRGQAARPQHGRAQGADRLLGHLLAGRRAYSTANDPKGLDFARARGRGLVLSSCCSKKRSTHADRDRPATASQIRDMRRKLPARRGPGACPAARPPFRWRPATGRPISARAADLVRGGARLVRSAADGGLPLGLWPVDQGRRGADVPGRGAAARARRRHDGRSDPRQDRAARLVGAFGRLQLDLRQCLDLGADADRPGARRGRGRHRRHAARHGAPARRAGDPHRRRRQRCARWASSSCSAAPSRKPSSAAGR